MRNILNKAKFSLGQKKLKSPFAYIGGKRKLAPCIVERIPSNHNIYVEVFGGGGSVLYAKRPSKFEVFNDINSELINLYKVMRNNPQSLNTYLNDLFISRDIFYDIKKQNLKARNHIEKAAFYFYLLSQSFGSTQESFAMQNKARRKVKNLYRSFKIISQRLKRVTIENRSFENLIPLYDNKDTFFYLDPPYISTETYYKNIGTFGEIQHKKLAKLLSNIKGRFLLSYNDCPLVRELYKDFNIEQTKAIPYFLGQNVHKNQNIVKEVFITNYEKPKKEFLF